MLEPYDAKVSRTVLCGLTPVDIVIVIKQLIVYDISLKNYNCNLHLKVDKLELLLLVEKQLNYVEIRKINYNLDSL